MKKLRIIILLLLLINNAKADLFTLHVEQGSINETRSFTSILDLFDKYKFVKKVVITCNIKYNIYSLVKYKRINCNII